VTKDGDGFADESASVTPRPVPNWKHAPKSWSTPPGPSPTTAARRPRGGTDDSSQGIHLCSTDRSSADNAIMVPHTSDGRVMFAIPWHGHTVVERPTRRSCTLRWNQWRWSRGNSFCNCVALSRQETGAQRRSQRSREFVRWCVPARAAIPRAFATTPSASKIPADHDLRG
jgi:hypothetical protein